MVQGGVKKDASVIPSCALDADCLVEAAHLFESLGDNSNVVLAEQSCIEPIVRPYNVLNATDS
jgi:hypothetical protein